MKSVHEEKWTEAAFHRISTVINRGVTSCLESWYFLFSCLLLGLGFSFLRFLQAASRDNFKKRWSERSLADKPAGILAVRSPEERPIARYALAFGSEPALKYTIS